MTIRYGSTQAAQYIRKALKAKYPKAKFSVRSSDGSVEIRWIDGPAKNEVEAIAHQYSNSCFDSSEDYAYSTTSWLLPDGSTTPARSPGSGSRPEYSHPSPAPEATEVCFHTYISISRSYTSDFLRRCAAWFEKEHGQPIPATIKENFRWDTKLPTGTAGLEWVWGAEWQRYESLKWLSNTAA